MTNLGIAGAVSLNTINQWISVIDTNLNNSKRIGYKETSVSFTAGEVGTYGTTHSIGKIQPITFPSASLQLSSTRIRDDVQGNLTPTGQITDFALSGKGYFVVEDMKDGRRYATRDGQFSFDTDGYLVTAEGLRVLTTGLDYFRVPASEQFSVNSEGESESRSTDPNTTNATFNPVAGVSSFSTSIYGNRKLLVIDIPTEGKLVYSKYGYTKFDLGKRVPVVVNNNFSEVMDGISPHLSDVFNAAGTNLTNYNQYFMHDVQNGTVKMSTHAMGTAGAQLNTYVQASVGGQKMGDFNAAVDFNIRDSGGGFPTSFGFTIGKADQSTTDQGRGIFVGVKNGQLVIRQNGANLVAPVGFAGTVDNPNALTLNPANTFSLKVDAVGGRITAQVFQNGASISGPITVATNDYKDGYMSIGTSADPAVLLLSSNGPSDNIVDITNLNLVERNRDSEYTTNIIQKNNRNIQRDGLNASYEETQVVQQSVEESTTTLADTLPLLSYAQKMFGAISKIISTYNTMTDDMNNIIR